MQKEKDATLESGKQQDILQQVFSAHRYDMPKNKLATAQR